MLRFLALILGIALLVVGILGFQKDFTPNGLLFGYFLVNPIHNFIHLVTGLIAVFCGISNNTACKTFFIVFGIIYLAFAGYGFYTGPGMLFDLIAINQADNVLHLIIGLIFLWVGLALKAHKV